MRLTYIAIIQTILALIAGGHLASGLQPLHSGEEPELLYGPRDHQAEHDRGVSDVAAVVAGDVPSHQSVVAGVDGERDDPTGSGQPRPPSHQLAVVLPPDPDCQRAGRAK